MALTAGQAVGDTAGLLRELTGAALAQLPAVLAIAAAVVAVFALLPRRAVAVSWLLLGASVLLSPVFGTSLGLPQWVLDLSPFTYQKAPALEIRLRRDRRPARHRHGSPRSGRGGVPPPRPGAGVTRTRSSS